MPIIKRILQKKDAPMAKIEKKGCGRQYGSVGGLDQNGQRTFDQYQAKELAYTTGRDQEC